MKRSFISYATVALLAVNSLVFAQVQNITSESDFDKIIRENNKVVAKLSMQGCPACSMVEKPFEALAEDQNNQDIAFLHIDVRNVPALSQRYEVEGVPTFIYIKNGETVDKQVGAPRGDFKETMQPRLDGAFSQSNNKKQITAPTPPARPDMQEMGMLSKLMYFIKGIFASIINAFNALLSAITGTFCRR